MTEIQGLGNRRPIEVDADKLLVPESVEGLRKWRWRALSNSVELILVISCNSQMDQRHTSMDNQRIS